MQKSVLLSRSTFCFLAGAAVDQFLTVSSSALEIKWADGKKQDENPGFSTDFVENLDAAYMRKNVSFCLMFIT